MSGICLVSAQAMFRWGYGIHAIKYFYSDSPCVHKVIVPPMVFGHTSQTKLLPWALVPIEASLYLGIEQNELGHISWSPQKDQLTPSFGLKLSFFCLAISNYFFISPFSFSLSSDTLIPPSLRIYPTFHNSKFGSNAYNKFCGVNITVC